SLLFFNFGGGYLTLRNGKTGELYARYRLAEGEEFSVGFIHSVNKSPVTDVYEIRDKKIFVTRTIYYGFGAGVQTELEGEETLTYGEDGSMIISGFNKEMKQLMYFVGTVSDHILTIQGDEISLRDLCGKSSLVAFSYEPVFFLR
ncbi:MAG: DUF1850 domain-containing protein, partial [Pygmaiobacter sp.]